MQKTKCAIILKRSVDQGALTLGRGSRDYYLNSTMFASHMTAYRKYLVEIANILKNDANLTREDSDIYKDINDIIAFEKKLAQIVVAEDERRNNTRLYNKRTMADLFHYMPEYINDLHIKVDWVYFFRNIAPDQLKDFFHNNTEVIVCEIDYLRKVSSTIQPNNVVSSLIANTNQVVLANYIIWRVVQSSVRFLDERFEDIKQDFSRVMTGQQQRSPRWKDCAQVPSTVLPLAAGAIYVDAHFNSQDKREAIEMIKLLRNSFVELVQQNSWMDEATKSVAIDKANSMIDNIGYPELTNDIQKLDEQYNEVRFTEYL
uniref:Peptidase_M13_N domain-containing protein n=1 Tax=Heterorhabditis bacteriophora TaxID=37862 RepID=A0A1I7WVX6_HETBA